MNVNYLKIAAKTVRDDVAHVDRHLFGARCGTRVAWRQAIVLLKDALEISESVLADLESKEEPSGQPVYADGEPAKGREDDAAERPSRVRRRRDAVRRRAGRR
jgi:hypothetical protein